VIVVHYASLTSQRSTARDILSRWSPIQISTPSNLTSMNKREPVFPLGDSRTTNSRHGLSFSLSSCGLISMATANPQVDIGPNLTLHLTLLQQNLSISNLHSTFLSLIFICYIKKALIPTTCSRVGLVIQSVEQWRSNPTVVCFIATMVRVFLFSCVGSFPWLRLRLRWI